MTPTRILIVEDERIIALDLKQQLESMNYLVTKVASTGAQAVAYAHEFHPNIVLMDIHLQGAMDGIDAAREIHEHLDVPIIFLTAYAEDATLRRAEAALPYGYLVKPVSPTELNATLKMAGVRHVAQQKATAESTRFRQALEAASLEVWEWDAQKESITVFQLMHSGHTAMATPICESPAKFYQRIDRRDIRKVKRSIEHAMNDPVQIHVTFRTRSLDGQSRWMEAHAKRFTEAQNDPGKLIGILHDITEKRRNEERLRQALAVFDSTAEGICFLNQQCRVVSVNPAFCRLTGYSEAEAKLWPDIHTLYVQEHSSNFFNTLSGPEHDQWQGNVRYHKKDGGTLTAWETVNVVRDPEESSRNYVVVFSDLGAVLAVQEQLEYMAKHDSLTSLCNRQMFIDRLSMEIIKCQRNNKILAVLMVDLDHFKTINDTLGHSTGDALLIEAAIRLTSCVRGADTVARLGGDEFIVIISDLDNIGVVDHIAQNILNKLTTPFVIGVETCHISGSIGIAVFPVDGTDVVDLLRNVDQAMYSAKRAGRNAYRFFEPAMQKAAEIRLQISNSLHDAINKDQFWMAYQPIIDFASGTFIKAEALIRWNHPQQGAISPAAFIPIAEDTGLITSISNWVLKRVTADLAEWRKTLAPTLRISVNISPAHFHNKFVISQWLDNLLSAGLPGEAIIFEITEGLLLDPSPTVMQVFEEIRKRGVQISLDDFGTGYSALSYLKKFSIDFLKIDKSFVGSMTPESSDFALCEAIIVMAHKLGIKVIAEGVETIEQSQLLQDAGCDFGQGYLFSRPVNKTAFSLLLGHSLP